LILGWREIFIFFLLLLGPVFVDNRTLFFGVVARGTFDVAVGTSDDNDEKVWIVLP
jgi:hypothetical protein